MSRRVYFTLLLLLAVHFLWMRYLGLHRAIWLDEYETLEIAKQAFEPNSLEVLRAHAYPPLFSTMLRIWMSWGTDVVHLRLLPLILSSIGFFLVLCIGRVFSRSTALLCVALFCASPFVTRYSLEIRDYSLFLIAVPWVALVCLKLRKNPEKQLHWIELGLALFLGVVSYSIGVFLLLPAIAFLIFYLQEDLTFRRVFYSLAPSTLAFAALYRVIYSNGKGPSRHAWIGNLDLHQLFYQMRKLFSSQDWGNALSQNALPHFLYAQYKIILLCMILFAFLGNRKSSKPIFLFSLFYFVQLISYSLFQEPILLDRTLLPFLLLLLIAFGVALGTAKKSIRLSGSICVFLFLLYSSILWVGHLGAKPIENWPAIVKSLKNRDTGHSRVLLYPDFIEGVFSYHTGTEQRPLSFSDSSELNRFLLLQKKQETPVLFYLVTGYDTGDAVFRELRSQFPHFEKIEEGQIRVSKFYVH